MDLRKSLGKDSSVFLIGGLYGMLLFVLLYGIRILDVTYDAWLMTGGDLSQHYIGWVAYRTSPWHFPIGLLDGLNYPNLSSVIFTDSIPIVAVFFKLLSPLLPDTFQYFGLFGIVSFGLMGAFASLLMKKLTNNGVAAIILSTIFVLSPYVMQRLYSHTSLGGGQWMIIAACYIWFAKPFGSLKKEIIAWGVLLFIATGTHIYFMPTLLLPCLFSCIENYAASRRISAFYSFASALAGSISCLLVFSAFYGNGAAYDSGLGTYSANLNSWFNPCGKGLFLPSFATFACQYEGFGYLGLGSILLLLVALIIAFCRIRSWKQSISTRKVLVLLSILCFAFFAVFPKVTFARHELFTLPLPKSIENLWSIFRSSGRFIWGSCYLLYIASIYIVFKYMRSSTKKIIAAFAVALIQCVDLIPQIKEVHTTEKYCTHIDYPGQITKEIWTRMISDRKYIAYCPAHSYSLRNGGAEIALLATQNSVRLNTFYLARPDYTAREKFDAVLVSELSQGIARDDMVYVFSEEKFTEKSYEALYYYKIDDKIVGLSSDEDYLSQYKIDVCETE